MQTLYLYGPPACGKSTLAKKLSRDFARRAVDLDEAIVEKTGMPIPRFFAERGERAFRELESAVLRETKADIVALGGGTLLDPGNREFAERNGFVAVLDVDEGEIARRIALAKGTRPLGDKAAERRAHYASFRHHAGADTRIMLPARLSGETAVPVSKSHMHRLAIASFLAGAEPPPVAPGECDDIAATRRCLAALAAAQAAGGRAVLDCGESGSTLRFLTPVAAALGVDAQYIRRGRLAERPMLDFSNLAPGRHELAGNVSSQFATGLIFALPLLAGDSEIVFSSPLESRGYVDMTLDVVRAFGVRIDETPNGFAIPGNQRFRAPRGGVHPEGDWSAAAFWFAANALGASIAVSNVSENSRQPDRAIRELAERAASPQGATIDISQCPDLYPALAAVAAATPGRTRFINAARLRIKESDRIAAMEKVAAALGAGASSTAGEAVIEGAGAALAPCEIDSAGDHRIAMAAAIASTRAAGPVMIHRASCVAKSYPEFFETFASLAAHA